MTSPNIDRWVKKNRELIGRKVADIGSRRYGDRSTSVREILSYSKTDRKIVGIDLQDGENVDVVFDLATKNIDDLLQLTDGQFDSIICLSVLEHVPSVWQMATNLQDLLRPGGSLFVSVPFVFRIHHYPLDCWRFTPTAVQHLFPAIDFMNFDRCEAVFADGSKRLSLGEGRIDKLNRFVSSGMSSDQKSQRKNEKLTGAITVPYMMHPTMLNMVGVKS